MARALRLFSFPLKVTFLLQCHLSAQPSRRCGSDQLREPSADFALALSKDLQALSEEAKSVKKERKKEVKRQPTHFTGQALARL